jgi:hypothetical protein
MFTRITCCLRQSDVVIPLLECPRGQQPAQAMALSVGSRPEFRTLPAAQLVRMARSNPEQRVPVWNTAEGPTW